MTSTNEQLNLKFTGADELKKHQGGIPLLGKHINMAYDILKKLGQLDQGLLISKAKEIAGINNLL